jgi:hypothetical protein
MHPRNHGHARTPHPPPSGGYIPYLLTGTILKGEAGGSVSQLVFTDDAATKLSGRMRQCF